METIYRSVRSSTVTLTPKEAHEAWIDAKRDSFFFSLRAMISEWNKILKEMGQ